MLGDISEVSFNHGSSISNIFGSIFYLCNCGNIDVDVRNYSMFQNHLLHVQIIIPCVKRLMKLIRLPLRLSYLFIRSTIMK